MAWRELRRGASMQSMRDRLYGELSEQAQVDALDVVMQHDTIRMTELADVLRVDRSTATRVVDRLERAGLVERVSDDGDRRGVRVVATAEGRRHHRELSVRRRTMLLTVLEEFSPEERERAAELLERLVEGVDRYVRSGAVAS